ncbi:tyrosine-type recombinase/integrase [Sulfurospirillum multivorans]|uniref:Recombinase-like protein n=1 Tax=Sulfurospirillum multivorans TaxID=66821 RepID=A0ABX5YYU6_SULMU|nr:tyrosine-type recombinase/integrase [Sulfurospirillum multivorans]QEH05756.1 recombinase-like protein [Sulfurospirillum multivorans]
MDNEQLGNRALNLLDLYFKDKNLMDIEFDDLEDFRDILLEIPKRLTTYNFFKGKDLDFILENNDDYDKLDNTTINNYIEKVNLYFSYMHKLKYIIGEDFIIPTYDENGKNREPYTYEEVSKIFDLMKNDTLENRFITYIAAYQGMRLKEITQLQKEDIVKIGDIFCISINTKEDKTTKTKKSVRTIPIHNKLLEFGLLEFVNSKDKELFTISNKNFSSYFRKYYKSLINDEKTFYCLRHLVIDIFKQSDCKIEHYQAFVGHSQGKDTITMDYGNPFNVKLLAKLLQFIDY